MDKFEHLGLLVYFGEKGSERKPLSQNTPFFANSDPDMPAAPVPASQVLDWLLQNIASTMEYISDRVSPKENAPSNSSDQDVTMSDVGTSSAKPSSSTRGPSLIEGISKSSCAKQASDLKGTSVKVNIVAHFLPKCPLLSSFISPTLARNFHKFTLHGHGGHLIPLWAC